MRKKKIITIIAVFLIGLIGIAITVVPTLLLETANPQTYEIKHITIQQEIKDNNTKYLYLCTTTDGESIVFENEDSDINKKWNSNDILAQLKVFEKNGEIFIVETRGCRIPFLSMHQNIIKVYAKR